MRNIRVEGNCVIKIFLNIFPYQPYLSRGPWCLGPSKGWNISSFLVSLPVYFLQFHLEVFSIINVTLDIKSVWVVTNKDQKMEDERRSIATICKLLIRPANDVLWWIFCGVITSILIYKARLFVRASVCPPSNVLFFLCKKSLKYVIFAL